MYIWILLATIMIALSFFNLSPRADKESVFTETKALAEVSRFRIEHSAFARVAECKMTNSVVEGTVVKFPEHDQDLYIWANKALPIGFKDGESQNTSYHYIYCLKGDLAEGGSPAIADTCLHTNSIPAYRYAVSFAPLPSRWRSKSENEDKNPDILPVLGNTIAKQFVKGTILGLVDCSADNEVGSATKGHAKNCTFKGTNTYERQKGNSITHLSFAPGAGNDFYSELFANEEYKTKCAGNICFFAVQRLSNIDVDGHCATLYEGDYVDPDQHIAKPFAPGLWWDDENFNFEDGD